MDAHALAGLAARLSARDRLAEPPARGARSSDDAREAAHARARVPGAARARLEAGGGAGGVHEEAGRARVRAARGHERVAGVDRIAEHRARRDHAAHAVAEGERGDAVLVRARAAGPVAAAAEFVAGARGAEVA